MSMFSTEMVSTTDKHQALLDLGYLYENMIMRNRSNGGYETGVEDLFRLCEQMNVDMVIMYVHIGCKAMSGYTGLFEEEARKQDGIAFLAQGTIYPDITESVGVKAHHNVGGLPDDLQFELVEPVKLLYKDEVRVVGKELGLPDGMVYRQPFPGPGLGVRCVGAITRDRLEALREADAIVREEIGKLPEVPWQYFCTIPDFQSTGIKYVDGKGVRYMGWAVIIRAVNTVDAVTATVPEIPFSVLCTMRDRIIATVDGVNRVLWDISEKPVATIEFE